MHTRTHTNANLKKEERERERKNKFGADYILNKIRTHYFSIIVQGKKDLSSFNML